MVIYLNKYISSFFFSSTGSKLRFCVICKETITKSHLTLWLFSGSGNMFRWLTETEVIIVLSIYPQWFLLATPLGWTYLHERSAPATTEGFPLGLCGRSERLSVTGWTAAVKEVLRTQLPPPLGDTHPALVRPWREITHSYSHINRGAGMFVM